MQNMELNKLSDDEIERVNGGKNIDFDSDSEYGKMLLSNICPECMRTNRGLGIGSSR